MEAPAPSCGSLRQAADTAAAVTAVNKTTGKVTVKKGTKKGKYKVVITVTKAANAKNKPSGAPAGVFMKMTKAKVVTYVQVK